MTGWNQGNTSGLRSRAGTGRRRRRTGDNESGRNSSLGERGRGEGEEDGRLSGIGWRGRGGKDGWDKQGSLDGTGSGRKSREGWTGLKQDSGTFGGYGDNSKVLELKIYSLCYVERHQKSVSFGFQFFFQNGLFNSLFFSHLIRETNKS